MSRLEEAAKRVFQGTTTDRKPVTPAPVVARAEGTQEQVKCHLIRPGWLLLSCPYSLKNVDRCKSIPGRQWDRLNKTGWFIPAMASAVARIHDLWAGQVIGDATYRKLLDEHKVSLDAPKAKTAEDLPAVEGEVFKSWDHQLRAHHFSMKLVATLMNLGMGCGKTKISFDLMRRKECKRILVIAPKAVVSVWRDQLVDHWKSRDVHLACLDKRSVAKRVEVADEYFNRPAEQTVIIAINYESARTPTFAKWSLKKHWDMVVLDESQKIKDPQSLTSRYAAKLTRRSNYRMCLSGTPMPHSPLDIFAQFRFLDPGIFGVSFTSFRARYARMGGFEGKEVIGFVNQDELARKMDAITFTAKTADVLDLPPATHIKHRFEMSTAGKKAYKQFEKDCILWLQEEKGKGTPLTAPNILVHLLRLQQMTGGRVTDRDTNKTVDICTAKRNELKSVLEAMGDEPIIVVTKFVDDLDIVRETAEELGRSYGEVSGRLKSLKGGKWAEGEGDVLGVQIQAGGVGIDLTRARYCVLYSIGYSYGDYEQMLARNLRPGQEHPCTYVHLIAEGTVDENVYESVDNKADAIGSVIERLT